MKLSGKQLKFIAKCNSADEIKNGLSKEGVDLSDEQASSLFNLTKKNTLNDGENVSGGSEYGLDLSDRVDICPNCGSSDTYFKDADDLYISKIDGTDENGEINYNVYDTQGIILNLNSRHCNSCGTDFDVFIDDPKPGNVL